MEKSALVASLLNQPISTLSPLLAAGIALLVAYQVYQLFLTIVAHHHSRARTFALLAISFGIALNIVVFIWAAHPSSLTQRQVAGLSACEQDFFEIGNSLERGTAPYDAKNLLRAKQFCRIVDMATPKHN